MLDAIHNGLELSTSFICADKSQTGLPQAKELHNRRTIAYILQSFHSWKEISFCPRHALTQA